MAQLGSVDVRLVVCVGTPGRAHGMIQHRACIGGIVVVMTSMLCPLHPVLSLSLKLEYQNLISTSVTWRCGSVNLLCRVGEVIRVSEVTSGESGSPGALAHHHRQPTIM